MLAMESHSETLAGQITIRGADGTFLTTHMAIGFDDIEARHVIRVDESMHVLDGAGMANPAVRFHFWVYRCMPDVNCLVHTHPPPVSALSLTERAILTSPMYPPPF